MHGFEKRRQVPTSLGQVMQGAGRDCGGPSRSNQRREGAALSLDETCADLVALSGAEIDKPEQGDSTRIRQTSFPEVTVLSFPLPPRPHECRALHAAKSDIIIRYLVSFKLPRP
jgi:hypothetical protein